MSKVFDDETSAYFDIHSYLEEYIQDELFPEIREIPEEVWETPRKKKIEDIVEFETDNDDPIEYYLDLGIQSAKDTEKNQKRVFYLLNDYLTKIRRNNDHSDQRHRKFFYVNETVIE